jgi:hypothetical protein
LYLFNFRRFSPRSITSFFRTWFEQFNDTFSYPNFLGYPRGGLWSQINTLTWTTISISNKLRFLSLFKISRAFVYVYLGSAFPRFPNNTEYRILKSKLFLFYFFLLKFTSLYHKILIVVMISRCCQIRLYFNTEEYRNITLRILVFECWLLE